MLRIIKLTGTWYSKNIDLDDNFNGGDIEDLKSFVNEGTPCIIVDSLEDFYEVMDINEDDVEITHV